MLQKQKKIFIFLHKITFYKIHYISVSASVSDITVIYKGISTKKGFLKQSWCFVSCLDSRAGTWINFPPQLAAPMHHKLTFSSN